MELKMKNWRSWDREGGREGGIWGVRGRGREDGEQ